MGVALQVMVSKDPESLLTTCCTILAKATPHHEPPRVNDEEVDDDKLETLVSERWAVTITWSPLNWMNTGTMPGNRLELDPEQGNLTLHIDAEGEYDVETLIDALQEETGLLFDSRT